MVSGGAVGVTVATGVAEATGSCDAAVLLSVTRVAVATGGVCGDEGRGEEDARRMCDGEKGL